METIPKRQPYNGIKPHYDVYTRTETDSDFNYQGTAITINEAMHIAFQTIPDKDKIKIDEVENYFFIHTTFNI